MNDTRLTLIQRITQDEPAAWAEMDAIYRPLIRGWLIRYRLQSSDVDDLTQDVMSVLVRRIGEFEHNGRVGAFRNWLRTTTVNLARNSLRRRDIPVARGGSEMQIALTQLADVNSEVSREFEAQHDRHVIAHLLRQIEGDFAPITMQIFKAHVVDGEGVAETAQRLEVSHASVHTAKSRVLRKLRRIAGDLLDTAAL